MPRVRVSGAIDLSLPHVPLWCAHGQLLYIIIIIVVVVVVVYFSTTEQSFML